MPATWSGSISRTPDGKRCVLSRPQSTWPVVFMAGSKRWRHSIANCAGALTPNSYRELRKQFDSDCAAGGFHWLPFSERLAARVVTAYAALPPSVHLRAADAVHLGCAAENALKEIYSNDANLMAAAQHFGLTAINVI